MYIMYTIISYYSTVSSDNFNSQHFKSRVSSPRSLGNFRFKMLFESSNLPGAGPNFPD